MGQTLSEPVVEKVRDLLDGTADIEDGRLGEEK